MRISSDFDFIRKFAKIFEFSIVMRCLSIRLVTMRKRKNIVTTHKLSISVVTVKNF